MKKFEVDAKSKVSVGDIIMIGDNEEFWIVIEDMLENSVTVMNLFTGETYNGFEKQYYDANQMFGTFLSELEDDVTIIRKKDFFDR